jgi:hypothetical protein
MLSIPQQKMLKEVIVSTSIPEYFGSTLSTFELCAGCGEYQL